MRLQGEIRLALSWWRWSRLLVVALVSLGTLAFGTVSVRAPGVQMASADGPREPAAVVAEPVLAPVADAPQEPEERPAPKPRPTVAPDDRIRQVPVLMYHEVGDVNNNNYVRRSEFEAQLNWLAENGYHAVTLGQVYKHINDFAPLPPKPVVITFDDGYATFHSIVVPTLRQHGFTATAFITTGLIGRKEHMTWDQVAELPNLGIEIGAHSVTHPDLRTVSGARLTREVAEAKRELEERTGARVDFFCYPAGKYNDQTPGAVKTAGYLGAVTTEYGPVTLKQSPFLWSRIRIVRGESPASFAKKIRNASGEGP